VRTLLGPVLALFLSGCSGHGAEGLPVPPPLDFSHLVRPATPNTALAAPAGFVPVPDIVTRRYDVPPAKLYALVKQVALAQNRTWLQVAYDPRLQAHFVARSAVFNFPDLIAAQVNPDGTLVLWSRSVYGAGDLGVNRRRLRAWLAALDRAVAQP
jgi:uncharacterized protein (DUF1499 family)